MSNESANIKHDGHRYLTLIGKHQARRSSLCQKNQQTPSPTVITTLNEMTNIKHDDHRYVKRITNTLKELRSRIRTKKPLRAHKPYMYTKTALRAQDVFIHISRLKRTGRIRLHKPLNAEKLYNLCKSIFVRTSRLTRNIRTTYAKPITFRKIRTTYPPRPLQPSR